MSIETYEKLAKRINTLADMPLRSALVTDNRLVHKGIRKCIVDIVFYVVNEKDKLITVIRILYKRRSWINLI